MASDIELLESFDPLAQLRNKLSEVGFMHGHYSGVPMPLEGEDLIIEKSHPLYEVLGKKQNQDDSDDGFRLRSEFYSHKKQSTILVMEKDGKIEWGLVPQIHGLPFVIRTLGCSAAWGLEQESKALNTLAGHVRHHQFKQYLLTGMFMERSKRSNVVYLFRKLRPTVAIRVDEKGSRILCALCMHPIAYYGRSYAGAMCPTDDVLAHLMIMRADEHMFWKRSNQHGALAPQAALN